MSLSVSQIAFFCQPIFYLRSKVCSEWSKSQFGQKTNAQRVLKHVSQYCVFSFYPQMGKKKMNIFFRKLSFESHNTFYDIISFCCRELYVNSSPKNFWTKSATGELSPKGFLKIVFLPFFGNIFFQALVKMARM